MGRQARRAVAKQEGRRQAILVFCWCDLNSMEQCPREVHSCPASQEISSIIWNHVYKSLCSQEPIGSPSSHTVFQRLSLILSSIYVYVSRVCLHSRFFEENVLKIYRISHARLSHIRCCCCTFIVFFEEHFRQNFKKQSKNEERDEIIRYDGFVFSAVIYFSRSAHVLKLQADLPLQLAESRNSS
jgi:hypothetical protein